MNQSEVEIIAKELGAAERLSPEDIKILAIHEKVICKFLQSARLSLVIQRGTTEGSEKELWGGIQAVQSLIRDVSSAEKLNKKYEDAKQQALEQAEQQKGQK